MGMEKNVEGLMIIFVSVSNIVPLGSLKWEPCIPLYFLFSPYDQSILYLDIQYIFWN